MRRRSVLMLMLLAACGGGDSTAPPQSRRGIQIVSGANVTDSIESILPQALVVEVRDTAGKLAPVGTIVRFMGVPNGGGVGAVGAFVQSLTLPNFSSFATGSTDQKGRTGVRVQLGPFAAPAIIVISAPTLNVSDTARYTVIPGAADRMAVVPADTVLYTGRSYTLRGGVVDRYGNARSDPVTWTSSGAGVSVTSAGVATASGIGRFTVTATAEARAATGGVSVVPQGTIAAWNVDGSYIATVELDGSNLRNLAPVSDGGIIGPHPSWISGTNRIIYSTFDGVLLTLRTVDETGVVRPFFSPLPPNVSHAAEPIPSPDGRWMFFSAWDTRCSVNAYFCLYRSAIDGSAPELLGNFIQQGEVSWRPSPSPDGTRVAFVTRGGPGAIIKVFDVTTKTVAPFSVLGQNPRWSRVGNQIAFVPNGGGRLMLMNSNGSGVRPITPPGRHYPEHPMTWSPDGRWILAHSDSGLAMIEVATGTTIPLAYGGALHAPSWK